MRDGAALAVLAVLVVGAGIGLAVTTTDLPADRSPDATFDVRESGEDAVVVEHVGGDTLSADAVRLLVYEDRRFLPDRTVHASTWGEAGRVRPGDRRRLQDRRFATGQRLVVRWYGEAGQANLAEARL